MHPMVNIAVRAARAGANIIVRNLDRVDQLSIKAKQKNDFVSEVDRAAEAEIIAVLKKAYPSHAILAEESGLHSGDAFQWIIDPLDGTTNFLQGIPHFAVSIALMHEGKLTHGVIYNPLLDELFTASRGSGAQLNNRKIRVSTRSSLDGTILGTGFPFREQQQLGNYLSVLQTFMTSTAGIRRAGAAALDLAYVACGRFDGFWESGLSSWDTAAGALLVLEAGGLVSDFSDRNNFLDNGEIVAGSPKVHAAMLHVIRHSEAA